MVAILLGLFLWAFKKLFNNVIEHMFSFQKYMDSSLVAFNKLSEAIDKLNDKIDENHNDLLSELRTQGAIPQRHR
jgi:hypothetical protein